MKLHMARPKRTAYFVLKCYKMKNFHDCGFGSRSFYDDFCTIKAHIFFFIFVNPLFVRNVLSLSKRFLIKNDAPNTLDISTALNLTLSFSRTYTWGK